MYLSLLQCWMEWSTSLSHLGGGELTSFYHAKSDVKEPTDIMKQFHSQVIELPQMCRSSPFLYHMHAIAKHLEEIYERFKEYMVKN